MTDAIHPAPAEFSQQLLDIDPILRYFHYTHLPVTLQAASRPFCELAAHIVTTLPATPSAQWLSASCWRPRTRLCGRTSPNRTTEGSGGSLTSPAVNGMDWILFCGVVGAVAVIIMAILWGGVILDAMRDERWKGDGSDG